ncbi:MAG: tyrosine-protein phosphatase [Bacteroidales bacterium]|nr:tyrosine-protein phosphatase [Bacteroidales bacterium]
MVRSFIGANTANFTKTLDLIDATYGSMANYLTGPLGLSQEDMAVLHNKYLQ